MQHRRTKPCFSTPERNCTQFAAAHGNCISPTPGSQRSLNPAKAASPPAGERCRPNQLLKVASMELPAAMVAKSCSCPCHSLIWMTIPAKPAILHPRTPKSSPACQPSPPQFAATSATRSPAPPASQSVRRGGLNEEMRGQRMTGLQRILSVLVTSRLAIHTPHSSRNFPAHDGEINSRNRCKSPATAMLPLSSGCAPHPNTSSHFRTHSPCISVHPMKVPGLVCLTRTEHLTQSFHPRIWVKNPQNNASTPSHNRRDFHPVASIRSSSP